LVVLLEPFGDPKWLVRVVLAIGVFPAIIALGASAKLNGTYSQFWLGRLSYPLYELHYRIVKIVGFIGRTSVGVELGARAALILAGAGAAVVLAAIALPLDARLRPSLARGWKPVQNTPVSRQAELIQKRFIGTEALRQQEFHSPRSLRNHS
jgi:peptidoglycan/LPS O-acetylase OafA/YrhL